MSEYYIHNLSKLPFKIIHFPFRSSVVNYNDEKPYIKYICWLLTKAPEWHFPLDKGSLNYSGAYIIMHSIYSYLTAKGLA